MPPLSPHCKFFSIITNRGEKNNPNGQENPSATLPFCKRLDKRGETVYNKWHGINAGFIFSEGSE